MVLICAKQNYFKKIIKKRNFSYLKLYEIHIKILITIFLNGHTELIFSVKFY